MSELLDAEKQKPQRGQLVLAWGRVKYRSSEGRWVLAWWSEDERRWLPDGKDDLYDVTHWAPLPKPPIRGQEKRRST